MTALAELIDAVIGVDTHRDTLTAAAVSALGGVLAHLQVPADAAGYRQLMEFSNRHGPGARCWAVEGASNYGAGLTAFLTNQGEQVVEVCRPKRPPRTGARKSDAIDAVRAAREVLSSEHLIHPRSRGDREALRVLMSTRASAVVARTRAINHLKALIVSAPEDLRAPLRTMTSDTQISYCAALRTRPTRDLEYRTTTRVLKCTAARVLALRAEANELEADINQLVATMAPQLLALPGVGPVSAAQVLISWSHPRRFRSEAAFAMFSGAAPIPASSGRTTRHRLNRSGDRQLNRALHTIVLTRARIDPTTQAYIARRTTEGKTIREIKRALKRNVARQLFKLLESTFQQPTTANETRQSTYQAPADTSPDAPRTVSDRPAESSS